MERLQILFIVLALISCYSFSHLQRIVMFVSKSLERSLSIKDSVIVIPFIFLANFFFFFFFFFLFFVRGEQSIEVILVSLF